MVTVRNKFDTLQEISAKYTPNDKYENFVTAHIVARTKLRVKRRVPLESIAVREKRDDKKKHPYFIK